MYNIALVVGFDRLVCEIRAQQEGGQYVRYSPGSYGCERCGMLDCRTRVLSPEASLGSVVPLLLAGYHQQRLCS